MNDMQARKFKCHILITSDRAFSGQRPDQTAPLLSKRVETLGYQPGDIAIIPDNRDRILSNLRKWIDAGQSLILTSGGTGLAPTDITADITLEIIDRRVPGMEEAMRQTSIKITPFAMLSRAVVGVAGTCLIVNLPGSPRGALENFEVIEPALEHALLLINGEKPDK